MGPLRYVIGTARTETEVGSGQGASHRAWHHPGIRVASQDSRASYSWPRPYADASHPVDIALIDEGEDEMKRRVWIVFLAVIAFTAVSLPVANAYVDPGTGSFVFQAVIGGLLAVGVGIKVFWKRLTGIVSRRDRDTSAPES